MAKILEVDGENMRFEREDIYFPVLMWAGIEWICFRLRPSIREIPHILALECFFGAQRLDEFP